MNTNLGNFKKTVIKCVSITPFDSTILDVVKEPSNKEVSNNESLRQVHWNDITMFKQN